MKHNDIITAIEQRLKENHLESIIHREEDFDLKTGKHGECDLYLVDLEKDFAYVFEIKTYDGKKQRSKAHNQLLKDNKYIKEFYDIERIFKFYAYSDNKNKNSYIVKLYKK